jgi:hypothetical protein
MVDSKNGLSPDALKTCWPARAMDQCGFLHCCVWTPKLRSDEGPNAEECASCQAEFDAPRQLEDWHSGHQEAARRSFVRCSAQC